VPAGSRVLVYTFTTRLKMATAASVRTFVLGILKMNRRGLEKTWIVATTPLQRFLRGLRPGVIKPRQIGTMIHADDGEKMVFQEGITDTTLRLSIHAMTP
jgi:hypothetical protein